MDKGKILKITFEFENSTHTLSGKDAEEWVEKVSNIDLEQFLFIKQELYKKYLDNRKNNPFNNLK